MPLSTKFAVGSLLELTFDSGMVQTVRVVEPTETDLNRQFGRDRLSVLERDDEENAKDLGGEYFFADVLDIDLSKTDPDWEDSPEVCELGYQLGLRHLLVVYRGDFFVEAGDFASEVNIVEKG